MGAFDPVSYINEPRWRTSRLGLGRMRDLLERLGRPQDSLKFVHVAGTNGKGSTCAFLASILRAAGYRTGLFTSPFIETFEERIRIDGENISQDDLIEATLLVRNQAERMEDHPTEFELMCAVALVHFARRKCDIVVMEVGLGGRLDATNVIDAPEVCIIARIGFDHTDLLGTTLAQIAKEKAGIIKRGAAVVSYPQSAEAMDVVLLAAREAGASCATPDFSLLEVHPFDLPSAAEAVGSPAATDGLSLAAASASASAQAFRLFSYGGFRGLRTRLLGSYQPQNAALAIEAVYALRNRGWGISDEAVCEGIAGAVWPGRFEVLDANPLTIVDGGHNPQGACALADTLEDVLPGKRVVFVMGVLADKDYLPMIEQVLPYARAFVAITPESPRALPSEELAKDIKARAESFFSGGEEHLAVKASSSVRESLEIARSLAWENDAIVAFGSLYSVAAVKKAFACLHGVG